MRWRFIDRDNQAEAAQRAQVIAKIDAWWGAFVDKTPAIVDLFAQRHQWDLAEWMSQTLQAVSPALMWEYGIGSQGRGLRLVITPESELGLRPLVDAILSRAPKLEGWEFFGYRLPETYSLARQSIGVRTYVDITSALVEARIGDHNQIDLHYKANDESIQMHHAMLLTTEALLGEEEMNTWIGAITVRGPDTGWGSVLKALKPVKARSVVQMPGTVAALIQTLKDQRPHEPLFLCNRVDSAELRQTKQSMIRLEQDPVPAEDYPGTQDVFLAVSEDSRLWFAQHRAGRFSSERFSRHGETFCYVKVDDAEIPSSARADLRYRLHVALNQALIPLEHGCVTGGATGLRYTYLDLALMHIDDALGVVKNVLRQAGVGVRSWVLFCDATLAEEWVGVYEQTPEPPKRSEK